MNKLASKIAGLTLVLFLAVLSSAVTGCSKNRECKAVVTVKDQSGSPMVGAEVELQRGSVTKTASTDASGTANFESQLPMILDIYINGAATGRVARFEEGLTDNVTIP
jgi:hypothetical protein